MMDAMVQLPLAVVTGASSGIGEAIARELHKRGHDVVLVARGVPRLEGLAKELSGTVGPTAEAIASDLTTATGLDAVQSLIAERRPDVLVNCAGAGWRGAFSEQPPEGLDELIELNIVALAQLSRAAFALMIARGTGKLMNVSSTASFVPGPSVAAYHASKAFVTSLTEALHVEASRTDVHVTALCPGITPTRFQARAGTSHA